jgi:hypothetical protein
LIGFDADPLVYSKGKSRKAPLKLDSFFGKSRA